MKLCKGYKIHCIKFHGLELTFLLDSVKRTPQYNYLFNTIKGGVWGRFHSEPTFFSYTVDTPCTLLSICPISFCFLPHLYPINPVLSGVHFPHCHTKGLLFSKRCAFSSSSISSPACLKALTKSICNSDVRNSSICRVLCGLQGSLFLLKSIMRVQPS